MLHKLKTGKLHKLLCLGAAVCLLIASVYAGFAAAPVRAAGGVTDVIELNPKWGKPGEGGLIEGRTYVTELTADSDNEPAPEGGGTRTLSSDSEDTKSASYSLFYESPGDYWYTLSIRRQGENDPIETYYVHVRVLYDADGVELHASSTFRVGSKEAVKGDFNPEDPEKPETPTPTPTGTASEAPTPTGTASATPTPTERASGTPTPTKTSKTPTPTGTSSRPTVTPGTSITTAPGQTTAARTGDASNAALYTILLAASAVLIFLIADNMRRSGK